MPRLNSIAVSVICAFAVAGCAVPSQKQADQPAVQPPPAANPGVTGAAMYRLGRYYEGQSRYDKAIAAYREALKRDPLLLEAYTGLGIALAAHGRYGEAIREFQAAAVLAPKEAYVQNNLGYAYLLSGADREAIQAFEAATQLDPRYEKARENLRIAQAKLGTATAQSAPAPRAGAPRPAAEAIPSVGLVQVAPQVFELRAPPSYRPIEVAPLGPLPQKDGPVAPVRSFKLEVSNGNGVLGMAKRTAGQLASVGVRTVRITNQRPFQQATTEVQYREGYAAEAAALASKLEQSAQVAPSKHLAEGIDVRLVLGKDVRHQAVVVRSSRRSSA